jgi:hypothetical protein
VAEKTGDHLLDAAGCVGDQLRLAGRLQVLIKRLFAVNALLELVVTSRQRCDELEILACNKLDM